MVGKAAIIRRFTATGQGAPPWTMRRRLEVSMSARTSSGSSRMRMKCDGTMNDRVPPKRSMSARKPRASKRGGITIVAPT